MVRSSQPYSHPDRVDFWLNRRTEMDRHLTLHKVNHQIITQGDPSLVQEIVMDYACTICCENGEDAPLEFKTFWNWLLSFVDTADYTDYTVRTFADFCEAINNFRERLTGQAWKRCFSLAYELLEAIEVDKIDNTTMEVSKLAYVLINVMVATGNFGSIEKISETTTDALQHYDQNHSNPVNPNPKRHRKLPNITMGTSKATTPPTSRSGTPSSTVATLGTSTTPLVFGSISSGTVTTLGISQPEV